MDYFIMSYLLRRQLQGQQVSELFNTDGETGRENLCIKTKLKC